MNWLRAGLFSFGCLMMSCCMAWGQDIAVSPASVDMGYRVAAFNSSSTLITISNGGTADIAIGSLTIGGSGADGFSVGPGSCPSLTPTIVPGGSCSVTVTFAPPSGQSYGAQLDIASNSQTAPLVTVPLSGTGVYPLAVRVGGSGTGTVAVSSSPPVDAGLSCVGETVFCGAFEKGTSVTLSPDPSSTSSFAGWSVCTMTMGDSCFWSINDAVDTTAFFTPIASLQQILNEAGDGETIDLLETTYAEEVVMNQPKTLILSGGWSSDYSSQTGFTTIQGSLTIATGVLAVENILVR